MCGNSVAEFLPYGLPPRSGRCPHCGAKPRNRAVLWYLREIVCPKLDPRAEVLEVGASRVAAQYHPREFVIGAPRYTAIDVRTLEFHRGLPAPHRFLPMDVTRMGFPADSYDLIICNHALPYIRDDRGALAEMYRCLKPDGMAMLDTPLLEGVTRSVADYRSQHPELDDAYFAENGDQWVYGEDFVDRVTQTGFLVRIDTLFRGRSTEFKRRYGLKDHQQLIVAFKTGEGEFRFSPAPSKRERDGPS